ncbi:MAG: AIR carboxylase family protein, partial [Planctomycetes bacterium]|nr:AIR carboxylase family protein [Planctomycetota bacterium]
MNPQVALLMGSDSDFPRLEPCVKQLRELEIPFTARVMSAHRTPAAVIDFVTNAKANGIRVIMCAAGSAAHLAGVVAAHTNLPVIGIPMDNPPLGGLDAL